MDAMSEKEITRVTVNVPKTRFDLVDAEALQSEAVVMSMGSVKYEERSWEEVVRRGDSWRYVASSLRHINAIQRGEIIDPESGEPHASHLACNAHFLAWAALNGYMKDNDPANPFNSEEFKALAKGEEILADPEALSKFISGQINSEGQPMPRGTYVGTVDGMRLYASQDVDSTRREELRSRLREGGPTS